MRKIWIYAVLTAALLGVAGCETKSIQPTKENSPLLADPDGKKMNIMSVTLFDRNDVPFMINEAKRFIKATDVNRKAFKFGIYPSVTAGFATLDVSDESVIFTLYGGDDFRRPVKTLRLR